MDPTGTIGMAPRTMGDTDIALAGGPGFMARLQQLGEQRDAAAKALAELKLGEKAADAFKKAEQMKKAAEDALVKAGQDVFDATRKAEETHAEARAVLANAAARSADADQRSAAVDKRIEAVERAEQDVMEERTRVRAVEKAAAAIRRDYETRLARLKVGLDEIIRT
jgi:hypothetical protein